VSFNNSSKDAFGIFARRTLCLWINLDQSLNLETFKHTLDMKHKVVKNDWFNCIDNIESNDRINVEDLGKRWKETFVIYFRAPSQGSLGD